MTVNPIKLMVPDVGEAELELVREVLESGYLVDGPMTRELERVIAEYVGVPHAVAVSSGTTALEMSLRALGVGPGDEVILPDFTHPATGLSVMALGALPVIVDVDLDTFNTNRALIEAAVTGRTRAAMPVSWGGQPLEIEEILAFCRERGIGVVEDAACCLGSKMNGQPVGSQAELTMFSFHPRKLFATGDGGCITTSNGDHAEFLRSYKNFGITTIDGRSRFARRGSNHRFSSILAAVGLGQVRRIDQIVDGRIAKAKRYDRLLSSIPGIRTPRVLPAAKHNFQCYCIYIEEEGRRDEVLEAMRERGIEVQIGTYAIHREPVFSSARLSGNLESSKKLADRLLTLPLHHRLSESDQDRVVEELARFFQ